MIMKPLMGGFNGWMERADLLMRSGASRSLVDYTQGFAVEDLVRWVVAVKLLYLVADVLCWLCIRAIAKKDPRLRRLEFAWLFHPILLFSVYLFGQYRILPALVIWASVALVQRGRKYSAALIFGALLLLDNFGWLILAPTVLIWGDGWRDRMRLMVTALVLPALILIPWAFASKGYVLACYFSPVVQKASMQGIFRSMTPEAALILKGLFTCVWLSTIGLSWYTRAKTVEDRLDLWAVAAGSVLLALYATSTTMIHYFMWVLPFWVLLSVRGLLSPRWLGPTAISLIFLFNLDSREMNLGLMAHLDPSFAIAPSFHEIMSQWLPWGKCIALARAVFSVICLFFIAQIVRGHLWKMAREGRR